MFNLRDKISNFFSKMYIRILEYYNFFMSAYNLFKNKLFLVKSIKKYENNKIENVYTSYLMSYFNFNNTIYKLVELNLQKKNIKRNIILENKTMTEIRNIAKKVSFDNNDLIPNYNVIFSNINLINSSKEKQEKDITNLCLTDYIDNDKKYNNTIGNILKFNKIDYYNTSKIKINYINLVHKDFSKIGKLINKELNVEEFENLHVSDLDKII